MRAFLDATGLSRGGFTLAERESSTGQARGIQADEALPS
jgi:hypothetical protein